MGKAESLALRGACTCMEMSGDFLLQFGREAEGLFQVIGCTLYITCLMTDTATLVIGLGIVGHQGDDLVIQQDGIVCLTLCHTHGGGIHQILHQRRGLVICCHCYVV